MAAVDPVNSLYLLQAADNLKAGLELLRDLERNNERAFKQVIIGLGSLPTAYPAVQIYPGGGLGEATFEDGGYPDDEQSFVLNMRVIAGKYGDKFDGRLERSLLYYYVLTANWLAQHKQLVFDPATQIHIPELRPDGIILRGLSRYGWFRDDPHIHVGFEFSIVCPFRVEIPEQMYPDLED